MPVKSKDSPKLGGTLSRFGGTTAVLKDLDCLEKQPEKKKIIPFLQGGSSQGQMCCCTF